jgi:hypothetical protein
MKPTFLLALIHFFVKDATRSPLLFQFALLNVKKITPTPAV